METTPMTLKRNSHANLALHSVGPASSPAPVAVPSHGTVTTIASQESGGTAREFGSSFSIMHLLQGLLLRWRTATVLGVTLAATFGTIAWYLTPEQYTAYALLRVSSSEQELIPDARFSSVAADRYYENTQVALIKSRPIVLSALLKPGVGNLDILRERPDPAAWLEESLKVYYIDKTDILRISLDGSKPKELAALVNAVKDSYLEQAVHAQRNQNLSRLEDLEKVYIGSEDKIRNQRAVLRQLAESLKSSDSQALSLKQKVVLDEYSSSKKELNSIQSQLRASEITMNLLEQQLKAGGGKIDDSLIPKKMIEEMLDSDPRVSSEKMRSQEVEKRLERLKQVVKPGHPEIAKLELEKRAATDEWIRLRTERREAILGSLKERSLADQEMKVREQKYNVEVWKRQEVLLKEEVRKLGEEAQSIGLSSFELETKRREIEDAEAVIKRLRQEKERLNVEVQSTKQRVTVLHAAEVPSVKNLSAQVRPIGMASFFGLVLGLGSVALYESRSRKILGKREIVHELGVRVVGEVPWFRADSADGLVPSDGSVQLLESMDGIRTILLPDGEQIEGRAILITSAVPKEGKTTLATQLAINAARRGMRTLLIDCDLRKPTLHEIFGIPKGPGLAELLYETASLAQTTTAAPMPSLWILPAGEADLPIHQVRNLARFRSLMKDFRSHYDLIVVDCSPILPVSDVMAIGRCVDGVIMSVRPKVSQMSLVEAAREKLASLRLPFLGAVVNGVTLKWSAYHYPAENDSPVHEVSV